MSWVEITLTVDELALAELVADAVSEFVSGGAVIQATGVKYHPDGYGEGIAPYRISGYIPLDENLEAAKQNILHALNRIGEKEPLPPASFLPMPDVNWVEAWKKNYRPTPVGKSLIILPAWEDNPQPDRLPIKIEPGMAFGTGTHPTTQLALALLETAIEKASAEPLAVIDVGCGSGILTIASAKLGLDSLLGVDTDPEAMVSARENARLNNVHGIEWGLGSVDDILAGEYSFRMAPIVVANIITPILIRLLDAGMAQLLAPGGVLILSGILEEHEPGLQDTLVRHGLSVAERQQIGEWVALAVGLE